MRLGVLVRSTAAAALALGTAIGGVALPAPAATPPARPSPLVRDAFRLGPVDGIRLTPNARNIAIRSNADGPLLLFLPATRANPGDYREFLDAAAGVGYHVLALDYGNRGRSVARTCARDARCYGELQANRFDGSHPTRFSSLAPSDSILARLRRALDTLDGRDPSGGWGRYLNGDRVRWGDLVLAGHSQGGGESAFIAHRHRVRGVLMFGAPVESDRGVTATWMARPGATSLDRYYGLDSAHDMYADRIAASWRALHLPGRPTAFDDRAPGVACPQLVTDRALGSPQRSHSLFITDAGPRDGRGRPVFRGAWLAMLRAVHGPLPAAA